MMFFKTLMADHFRHISDEIPWFFDAIPQVFDAVSQSRWSEPRLARAQTNSGLQCRYWPPCWEFWLLAGHPHTLDVRTACKRAPGSANQIISCGPSTLARDGTSGDGTMLRERATHSLFFHFFLLLILCKKKLIIVWSTYFKILVAFNRWYILKIQMFGSSFAKWSRILQNK